MKYIKSIPSGGWDLDGYFEYLRDNEKKMPRCVFDFAIDKENYSLDGHKSLHDAWLDCIVVSEPAEGSRSEIRRVEIDCKFLGPFHDLHICIKYIGVMGYKLLAGFDGGQRGHGDLLMHEVRLDGGDNLVHEMIFSSGGSLEIICKSFWVDVKNRENSLLD